MDYKKKSILFLLNRESSFLPPFLAMLDALCDAYSIKVISYEKEGELDRLNKLYGDKDVTFVYTRPQLVSRSIGNRITGKVRRALDIKSQFVKEAENLIDNIEYDLLWVIHERTLAEFGDFLARKRYVVSLYELNDQNPAFLERIKPYLQHADEVMIPEYNRSCILRVWCKLDRTPTVVPNKPYSHPRTPKIPNKYSELLSNKKILLYQGYIQRSRNVDMICEACDEQSGYTAVILGKGDSSYIEELKCKYPHMIHIPFILPPEHLHVTSWARIAVVKYDFVALNGIFCAPNKIWEYSGFGIPVLGNNIPGLEYTVGQARAGICCNLDDTAEIKKAIAAIECNYADYSRNASEFYDSFDLGSVLNSIAARNAR